MNNPATDIQTQGREVVRALQVSLRTVRSHGWSNEASTNAIESLAKVVNQVIAESGEFGLHTTSDFVFIEDTRLKVDAAGYDFEVANAGHYVHEEAPDAVANALADAKQLW